MAKGPVQIASVVTGGEFTPAEQAYFETGGNADPMAGAEGAAQAEVTGAEGQLAEGQVAEGRGTDQGTDGVTGAEGAEGTAEGDGPVKMVPHAAMHEERERRKEAERQIQTLQTNMNTLMERFSQVLDRQNKPAVAEPAKPATPEIVIPPVDKDPIGHFQAQIALLSRGLNEMMTHTQQQTQQQTQMTEQQRLQARAAADEQAFAAQTPDYQEAVNHLRTTRDAQLQLLGIADPQQRMAILGQEALGIAENAYKANKTPSEVIYALAKSMGYAPKAQAQAPAAGAAAASGTPAAGTSGGGTPAATAAAAVQRVADGQRQAAGLGNARGSAPAPMTPQRILEMGDAEFAKFLDTPEGKAMMGA